MAEGEEVKDTVGEREAFTESEDRGEFDGMEDCEENSDGVGLPDALPLGEPVKVRTEERVL